MLTTQEFFNWHPLTWLSHMLDYQLYGLNPAGHHLTNVAFHLANILLIFFVFLRMTGGFWQSACVSALFALHPLHVESVAWVSERKDLLCTFFWILTLYAYVCYVEKPTASKYGITLLCFALGILSKPMIVTLPFILVLLDYWPLRRINFFPSSPASRLSTGRKGRAELIERKVPMTRLILEKIPFFGLAIISSIVTYHAQDKGGGGVL